MKDTHPSVPQLVERAFSAFEQAATLGCRVEPSMPILWFGDLQAYFASTLRVVTVGLNPSRKEFPEEEPFLRFPLMSDVGPSPVESEGYVEALNQYYQVAPYSPWFNWFEGVLNGMDASYGLTPRKKHRALHTDICSPVATDPTWSKLSRATQESLASRGRALWLDLIWHLQPHVVVASVAAAWLKPVTETPPDRWPLIHTVQRDNPYRVHATTIATTCDWSALLVFGRVVNTPFGNVSQLDRMAIGESVLSALRRTSD